ncbi:XRE family transcriptional regulator [Erwinia psidii]|uniref:helix-turn-helix transcriptional regulator n=1 Tax=Erwinia psidii TaxID=69224 RepID=UPI00226B2A8D|nr:helix-turn-helix transcriptional regulator [Erwinia psidii]MCX8958338.1 XRE family transcriptional regulator [Erwinia psidii]
MHNLSTVRKSGNITQRQLASHLGWWQSRIANYENGRVPDLKSCRKIIRALKELGVDCSLDNVFPEDKA